MKENSRSALALLGWLALCFAVAAIGGFAAANASAFYATLTQPAWAPPGWVFGPVWTVLYALMAVAAWLVWRERGRVPVRGALILFVVQLAVNGLWSWPFFAWRQGGVALAEVLLLWMLIIATALAFRRIRPLAAALLLPYLAWVTLASVLNAVLWRMNPDLLG
ncbi:MAG: TspO/MBR family protein [Rubrivivax sp.]